MNWNWYVHGDASNDTMQRKKRRDETNAPPFASQPQQSATRLPPVVSSNTPEELLAQEISRMSIQERERVVHEIHGIDDTTHEDGAMVRVALQQLNDEFDRYLSEHANGVGGGSSNNRNATPFASHWNHLTGSHDGNPGELQDDALYVALQESSQYVRNPSFLVMFLRTEKWNVSSTVTRIKLFFEHKMDLFGHASLGRDITIQDDFQSSKDDFNALQSGFFQLLPGRDRAGRSIVLSLAHLRKGLNLKSIVSFNRWKTPYVP